MGKYLKKIENTAITGVYSKEQLAVMNHYRHQPNHGDTVILLKNPDTLNSRVVFVNNNTETDYETQFTWRFGYNTGHPCIFITFTGIKQELKDTHAILCLETNTGNKDNTNQSINVFKYNKIESEYSLRTDNENITWIDMVDIEIGREYVIYIAGNRIMAQDYRFLKGPWRNAYLHNIYRDIPSDWEITLNIRPCIKIHIGNSTYSNYKALAEYQEVSYLFRDER